MNNFSLNDKLALEVLVEAGQNVSTVTYDPNTIVGNPEAAAIAAGWIQYYKEATANLIEVIYIK